MISTKKFTQINDLLFVHQIYLMRNIECDFSSNYQIIQRIFDENEIRLQNYILLDSLLKFGFRSNKKILSDYFLGTQRYLRKDNLLFYLIERNAVIKSKSFILDKNPLNLNPIKEFLFSFTYKIEVEGFADSSFELFTYN